MFLNLQLLDGEQAVWSIPKSHHQHYHPQKHVCSKLFPLIFHYWLYLSNVRGGNGLKSVLNKLELNAV